MLGSNYPKERVHMVVGIISSLIAALVFFLLGMLVGRSYRYCRDYHFYRLFRRWVAPDVVVVLESVPIEKEHATNALGDGCIDALLSLLPYVTRSADKRLHILQHKDLNEELRQKDLIVIGGPLYNTLMADICGIQRIRDNM